MHYVTFLRASLYKYTRLIVNSLFIFKQVKVVSAPSIKKNKQWISISFCFCLRVSVFFFVALINTYQGQIVFK